MQVLKTKLNKESLVFNDVYELIDWCNASVKKLSSFDNDWYHFKNEEFLNYSSGKVAHPASIGLSARASKGYLQSLKDSIYYDVSGGNVDVAAYLAGEAECMISMERVRDSQAPLSVVIDPCIFADEKSENAAVYFGEIVKLLFAESAKRIVTLYVYQGLCKKPKQEKADSGLLFSVEIGTNCDLQALALALCQSVVRRFIRTKMIQLGAPKVYGTQKYGETNTTDAAIDLLKAVATPGTEVFYIARHRFSYIPDIGKQALSDFANAQRLTV